MQLRFLWKKVLGYLPSVFLGLLIAVPAVTLIWFVLFTDTFTVQAITVLDARPHVADAVEAVASGVKGKNMLFLQMDIVEQQILADVTAVRTVHGARKLPGTLKLIIQEKAPRALLVASGTYYFLDEGGNAYEEARLETLPGIVLPTLKVVAEASVTPGTQVVEPKFILFVEQVQQRLPAIVPAQVVEIRIPSLGAREVHFSLSNNWELRFDSTRSAQAQLGVLEQLIRNTISETESQTLEYIDLRIPNRVYYKARSAPPASAASVKQSPLPDEEKLPSTSPE